MSQNWLTFSLTRYLSLLERADSYYSYDVVFDNIYISKWASVRYKTAFTNAATSWINVPSIKVPATTSQYLRPHISTMTGRMTITTNYRVAPLRASLSLQLLVAYGIICLTLSASSSASKMSTPIMMICRRGSAPLDHRTHYHYPARSYLNNQYTLSIFRRRVSRNRNHL